jgi:SAM-dependent methyltransferase
MQSQYHAVLKDESSEQRLKFAKWYFEEKIQFACTHARLERGSVFDIGCGQGEVLKLCEEYGWRAYGVEPDKNLAEYAINIFGLSGVKHGILDRNFVPEEKVDLVFTNHAFEHFANLDEVMLGIKNIIKTNGYLFIAIPTYFENKSSLSRAWMNSSHYSLFTHQSLRNLLSRHGFEEVAHTYNGWKKEVDDLWYLAKYTGKAGEPEKSFEDPRDVYRYLHVVNPLRSFFFYPVYSNWTARVRIYTMLARALKLLVTSPSLFLKKVVDRIA